MTTKEMVYTCDVNLRNVTKSENIDIKTADWIIFLNQAQELIFRNNIPIDSDTYSQFDLNPSSRSNLAKLIKDKQYTSADNRPYTTSKVSGINFIFEYPKDLKYVDVAEAVLTKNGKDYICRVKDIEPRYYYQNRKNPFKKPYSEIVWRLDYGSNGNRYNEIVIPDGFSLKYFTLRYLIELSCLTLESDSLLADSLHYDIVNKAVDLCIESHQKNLLLTNLSRNDS